MRGGSSATPRSRRAGGAWLVALVAWVAVIWGHSLVAGPQSSAESGFFVGLLRPILLALGVAGEESMSFVVRKCAHFTEYAVLGVLVVQNLRVRWPRLRARAPLLVAAAACVPFVDEWIQLSVPGRAGALRDVLLDLSGLATGLVLTVLFQRLFQSR